MSTRDLFHTKIWLLESRTKKEESKQSHPLNWVTTTMEDPQGLPLQWQAPPQEQCRCLTRAGDRRITKMMRA